MSAASGSVVLAVVPQVHQSVRLELLPTQGALCLGVAPLCDALPAEEMPTGGGGGVSPLFQAEDAAGSSGAGGLSVLQTEVPVELPLLPGSLSLSEVVQLQTHSDEQLEEGDDPQQPVAAPDGAIIAVQPCYSHITDTSCSLGQVIE